MTLRPFFPLVFLTVALAAAPVTAMAQVASGLKIGVVNFGRLLQESPQTEAISKALDAEFAPRQRDLVNKQNDLKDRQTKLQKDAAVMGAEELRNAESKFREDEREFSRRANAFQEDINVRRNEEISKLQIDLLREVQVYARDQGYDLIVGDGVLYAAEALDLTEQILVAIQAKGR